MHLLIRILCYTTMVLTAPIIKYNNPNSCNNLQCENDSHCMETLVLNSSTPPEAEARCVCHENFIGPRCEAKFSLQPSVIKSNYISFTMVFYNVSSGLTISSEHFQDSISYSVQYWKNSSEKSCSIATNINSQSHKLDGLQSDTVFTICAVTGPADWCMLREINTTRDKNCIVIRTLQGGDDFLSQPFVLPVAITVIIILVVSIFGIIFLLKRQYTQSYHVAKPRRTLTNWTKERRKEKQRVITKEYNMVKESSLDDLLTDSFSSADNSIDRRTTRQGTGTSTFVPVHHNRSLPNVLEEETVGETTIENESSHMLQCSNRNST